jgi:endonuclease/exonuclease/phosphatase family metal-dependent hydrolase
MRIGTFNLAGRWSPLHHEFLAALDCDVWLLTEVSERTRLDGYDLHLGEGVMAPKRRWAAVAATGSMSPHPDPHPASAMIDRDGLRFCSSILPWRGCGSREPWGDGSHAEKTWATLRVLETALPTAALVWGGDWNHALTGSETAGSQAGREALLATIAKLNLTVPTTEEPHRIDGITSIDHIAVPNRVAAAAERVVAEAAGKRLSDHDAYVVTAEVAP